MRSGPPPAPGIEARSLKAQCAALLEGRIISGELPVGAALPPERSLAKDLGVSRPVLHEAIVELAGRGFLAVEPRRGVKVKDFYRQGTLTTFEALARHEALDLSAPVVEDILAFRGLIEIEAARRAAQAKGGGRLFDLEKILAAEAALDKGAPREAISLAERVDLDVGFHLLVAEASGSLILPLVLNSIAPLYRTFVAGFYRAGPDLAVVRRLQGDLLGAIASGSAEEAGRRMAVLLDHGAAVVRAGLPIGT